MSEPAVPPLRVVLEFPVAADPAAADTALLCALCTGLSGVPSVQLWALVPCSDADPRPAVLAELARCLPKHRIKLLVQDSGDLQPRTRLLLETAARSRALAALPGDVVVSTGSLREAPVRVRVQVRRAGAPADFKRVHQVLAAEPGAASEAQAAGFEGDEVIAVEAAPDTALCAHLAELWRDMRRREIAALAVPAPGGARPVLGVIASGEPADAERGRGLHALLSAAGREWSVVWFSPEDRPAHAALPPGVVRLPLTSIGAEAEGCALIVHVCASGPELGLSLELIERYPGVVLLEAERFAALLCEGGLVSRAQRAVLASHGSDAAWRDTCASQPLVALAARPALAELARSSAALILTRPEAARSVAVQFAEGAPLPLALLPAPAEAEFDAYALTLNRFLAGAVRRADALRADRWLAPVLASEPDGPWVDRALERLRESIPSLRPPRLYLPVPADRSPADAELEKFMAGLEAAGTEPWPVEGGRLHEGLFWVLRGPGGGLPGVATTHRLQPAFGDELLARPQELYAGAPSLARMRVHGLAISLHLALDSLVVRGLEVIHSYPDLLDRIHCLQSHVDVVTEAARQAGCRAALVIHAPAA